MDNEAIYRKESELEPLGPAAAASADRDPEHLGDGLVTPIKESSSLQGLQQLEFRRRLGGYEDSDMVSDLRSEPSSKDSAWW